jgi:uroporphyrinogen-III synthase
LTAKEFRQQKVSILSHTAVVFTSRHAIDFFFQLAKELRLTIPEDMKYFCITETISLYIQKSPNTASARYSSAPPARSTTSSPRW